VYIQNSVLKCNERRGEMEWGLVLERHHIYIETHQSTHFNHEDETLATGRREVGENCIMRIFISCALRLRMIKSRISWAGHVARIGAKRNAYRILVGKPEGKRTLGIPRGTWVDNIKIDIRKIGWGGMDWIDLVQDRDQWRALVNTVMNLRVP
jgi:hypothetical protein